MAFFYIWETVDFRISLTNDEEQTGILDECKNIIITLAQTGIKLEKDITSPDVALDIENDTINLHLSQEDTGLFRPSAVQIQINILYENTERDTTVQGTIKALDNLHKEVMT